MIIVDTSIVLQWILPEPDSELAFGYLASPEIAAPDVLLVEVANVLAKKVRAEDMTGAEALEALALVKSPMSRLVLSEPLVPRALELSIELSHPVYDCVFLACAEHMKASLATRDAPFIKRVRQRGFGELLAEGVP